MLLAVVALGIYTDSRSGFDGFDIWWFQRLGLRYGSRLLHLAAQGGNPLLVAIVAVGAAWTLRRDWTRSAACLLGPLLAGAMTEFVFKPSFNVVGSRFTFPSGHTTGTAAIGLLVVFACPAWKKVVVPLALLFNILSCLIVVAIGWHTMTGALAGVFVGAGALFLVDGALGLWATLWAEALGRTEQDENSSDDSDSVEQGDLGIDLTESQFAQGP